MGLGVLTKLAMLWEIHAEQWLSMPMERESVSKQTRSGQRAPVAVRARTWSARMACGRMCMRWAECFQAMAWLRCRTCCQCHVSFQESMLLLAFLIQDFSTCPHCPISHLNGECCNLGMYNGGLYAVDMTGIIMAVASRSQPHFWSWLSIATSPGGTLGRTFIRCWNQGPT